jgi:murein DD-endopeptidase MepM/ murein hydrolase activator NlpD
MMTDGAGAVWVALVCSGCRDPHPAPVAAAPAPAPPHSLLGALLCCSACQTLLPPASGHARVRGTTVELLCRGCAEPAPPPAAPVLPPAPGRRRPGLQLRWRLCRRWLRRKRHSAALLPAVTAFLVLAPAQGAPPGLAEPLLMADTGEGARAVRDPSLRIAAAEHGHLHPLASGPEQAAPIASDWRALIWYHPLVGHRELPGKADRRFGAERTGRRPECGRGHCGVDIGDQRGDVVHAVQPGLVERIVGTSERKGGRYVKLRHPSGFVSYYMHLDRIHPDLVPGVEVAAGDPLGTLGSSGVEHSPPHLHFAVAMVHEDGSETFVDPEPMLRAAVLLDSAAPFPAHGSGSRGEDNADYDDRAHFAHRREILGAE